MSRGFCPFCNLDPARVFYEGDLVIALWDSFPVAPGHVLLVPRRHVPTWFDATFEERMELMAAIDIAKDRIVSLHKPDGFNLGVNIGEAAGQTIFHLHLHVIPRYFGDVQDPTGGVRHVIPARGNYLKKDFGMGETAASNFQQRPGDQVSSLLHEPSLVCGEDDPRLPHLPAHLND